MTVNPRRPITLRGATNLGRVTPVPGTAVNQGFGKKTELIHESDVESRDSQPMTTTCARCPATHVGLTGDGRAWFRAHLADRHPEVQLPRRSRSRGGWKKSSEADREAAMVEVEARKARLV